jgi:hypothetical protein
MSGAMTPRFDSEMPNNFVCDRIDPYAQRRCSDDDSCRVIRARPGIGLFIAIGYGALRLATKYLQMRRDIEELKLAVRELRQRG